MDFCPRGSLVFTQYNSREGWQHRGNDIKAALTLSAFPLSQHSTGSVLTEGFHYLRSLSVHFFFSLRYAGNGKASVPQLHDPPSPTLYTSFTGSDMLFCSPCIIVKGFLCNRWKCEMTTRNVKPALTHTQLRRYLKRSSLTVFGKENQL